MKILAMPQGSSEWATARLGVVTASEADALVSPEGKVRTGQGPRTYLFRKLAEKIMGYAGDDGSTYQMDQGAILEKIALPWYSFQFDTQLNRVGFCLSDDGRTGCSPDALIGEDGGLEIKCPSTPVHLQYLLDGVVPKDYVIQVQFSLWVTQRRWWKFVSYSRHLPALVVHVEPDVKLQNSIAIALAGFAVDFDTCLNDVRAKQEAEAPKEQSR